MTTRCRTRLLVAAGLLAALGGCVTSQISFEKGGVSAADRQRDENACLRVAIGADITRQLLAPYRIDRNAFIECVERRGYTAKRE